MSEQLYIRLGWRPEHPCHWLVYSDTHADVIASGVIENASELHQVKEHALERQVIAFVSASALHMTSVELPEKGQRQAIKALPYLLEEQLTDDVSKLHFVTGSQLDNTIDVAVVAKEQMEIWSSWLTNAGLKAQKFLPDCLAIPRTEQSWSALQIDDQWLIRTGLHQGMTIDSSWLPMVASRVVFDCDAKSVPSPEVAIFSDIPNDFPLETHQKMLEQPMLILAKNSRQVSMNLLTGAYQPRKERSKHWKTWRMPGLIFCCYLVLSLVSKGLFIWQNHHEIEQIKEDIVYVFHTVKPNSNLNVNLIRGNLQNELKQLRNTGVGGMFFVILDGVQNALHDFNTIEIEGLRFDASRKEFTVQLQSTSYTDIESFIAKLKKNYAVKTGAMDNQQGVVSGRLVLKEL